VNAGSINRLLAPRTVALFGSAWADAVDAAGKAVGFSGEVWRIHPKRPSTADVRYFRSIDELPDAPDASFVAAPAREVPNIAAGLARRGAGGFVCFAAGFSETGTGEGRRLTSELVSGAGELPFFGPNCYGFINFFDQVALWPDQVVGHRVARGVAIICQSGTLALNLLFNGRSLPIGYVLTVGSEICASCRQSTRRWQTYRVGESWPDRGRGSHRPYAYRFAGWRRRSVRFILQADGNRPL
jgi:acyl-CoA synthetase (NDP forming)